MLISTRGIIERARSMPGILKKIEGYDWIAQKESFRFGS
jgi:hypothetical protein